jgi:hypothetical protein
VNDNPRVYVSIRRYLSRRENRVVPLRVLESWVQRRYPSTTPTEIQYIVDQVLRRRRFTGGAGRIAGSTAPESAGRPSAKIRRLESKP